MVILSTFLSHETRYMYISLIGQRSHMCGISTSHDTLEPAAPLASPLVSRLVHLLLLAPVAVLPALHQHHQGVEPEEDDHWDQDPLQHDPYWGAVLLISVWDRSVILHLLYCCLGFLESKSESTPHCQIEEDEEGDNLRDLYLFVSKTSICFVSKSCVKVFLSHLPSWLLRVPLFDGLV